MVKKKPGFFNKMAFKTKMVKKRRVFLTKSGSVSHMSRKKHRERPCGGRSPGEGGVSGGMVAHDLVKAAEKEIGIERP